jgi:N-acetylglutamate synthase-like GNAT family acetyltransferase
MRQGAVNKYDHPAAAARALASAMATNGRAQPDRVDDEPDEEAPALVIRPASIDDKPQIERLFQAGLLPGHVDYESERADRIRRSLGSARERFLVAETPDGKIIGTIAIIEASPDVGHLHWLRVDPQWQSDRKIARLLGRAAAEHARAVGLLKLAMHAPPDVEQRIASYYHRLGFELSRTREIDGVHVLEFYLNLYEKPELGDAP